VCKNNKILSLYIIFSKYIRKNGLLRVNDIMIVNSKSKLCICDRNSDKNILLIGSCRITPFVNYFANDKCFDSYNILAIMVHNTEMIALSKTIIDNEDIKQEIYKTTILVHEF